MKLIRVKFKTRVSNLQYGGIGGLLDMLRYSACWPYSQVDVSALTEIETKLPKEEISFQVMKYIDRRGGNIIAIAETEFSFDRWKSFDFYPTEIDGMPI